MPFGSQGGFNNHGFSSGFGFGSDVSITSKTATEHSKIIVEKRDEKNEIVEISPVKSIVYAKSTSYSLNINQNSNSCDAAKLLASSSVASINKPAPISEVIPMDTSTAVCTTTTTTTTAAVAKETKAQVEPKVQKQTTREEPTAAKPVESATTTTKPSKSGASSLKTAQNEQNKPAAFSTPNNSKQAQKQTSVAKPAPVQTSTNVNSQQVNGNNHTDLNRLPPKVNTPQKSHSDHHLVSNSDFQFQFLKQIDVISDKNFIKIVN